MLNTFIKFSDLFLKDNYTLFEKIKKYQLVFAINHPQWYDTVILLRPMVSKSVFWHDGMMAEAGTPTEHKM